MVRKVVIPARISVRTVVLCALSWNSLSSMGMGSADVISGRLVYKPNAQKQSTAAWLALVLPVLGV
ncbi:hypothetical protein GCM10017655_23050 [Pseudomonas turukhanskensis]|uniref:Uncharacterized protein n=1 Tax=Pseudomonas turukhanskensis TaxID=1806536 RepID=A0A9W6K956_9PSED|nr:hypothetical protein GCM10017655_23050 [Pseudomonas turukhanskensis]